MPALWCRIVKRQRITAHTTEPLTAAASLSSLNALADTLEEACRKLDIPRPLRLKKHERDYASHGKTFFTQDHFMEHISFDRFEIELIDLENKPDRPRDPRSEA